MRMLTSFLRATGLILCFGMLISPPVHAQKAPKKERNRISREELVQAAERYTILYDAIRNLRPHFLQVNARGVRTTGIGQGAAGPGSMPAAGTGGSYAQDAKATVYVDGTRSGDPEILKNLSTSAVAEVRYLTPTEAENELGPRNEGGAILVKLAKP